MNEYSSADTFGVLRRELRDTRTLASNMDNKLRQVLDDRHRPAGSLGALLWKGLAARIAAYAQFPSASVDDAIEHLRKSADFTRLEAVTKATTNPAQSTVATWAAELTTSSLVIEFVDQLQPSIFSQLFAPGRATNIPVPAGTADIKIPARTPTGGSPTLHGSFVAEGNPIAVRKSSLAQVSLAPKKLGVITSYTDELANYSAQALEPLLRMMITGDAMAALDSILLDATASSSTRPAGLRFGAVAVPPAGAGAGAMATDIGALIAAISPATRIAVLVNPKQAAALSFAAAVPSFTLMASSSVAAGRVIAVDLDSLLAASWGPPNFEVTNSAVINEDDVPLPLGTPGSPNTVAAPMRSLFQSDAGAVRMIWKLCWATTRSNAVAVADPVTW